MDQTKAFAEDCVREAPYLDIVEALPYTRVQIIDFPRNNTSISSGQIYQLWINDPCSNFSAGSECLLDCYGIKRSICST